MTQVLLQQIRIHAGVWEGLLTGSTAPPRLEALHLEMPLDRVLVSEMAGRPGHWAVQVPIPPHVLTQGVQTVVIRDAQSGDQLAHFTVITGVPLDADIRAELDLLRAELDLLKRAFRRHCVESTG